MEDRSGQIKAVAILFLCLTWLTVILRVYVRTIIVKGFGIDDTFMLVTLALFTSYTSCQLGGIAHGTGKHRDVLTDANAQIALRYWFFCEIFYTLSTSTLKVAIGFFLLRITIKPLHIWLIRIIMVTSVVLGVTYCGIVLFQCKPISYWWDLNPNHHGTCLSATIVADATYIVSGLNSFADWTFGVLPVFIVKDLQMKTSVKVVVCSIIGFAAIGSTATIIRLPYTWTLKQYKGDFLYRTSDVAIWTTVEVGIGITAGCIATLRPLMKSGLALLGVHSTTPLSSGLPWSRSKRAGLSDQPLDNLRPVAGKAITTTTVTGRRISSESDEEIFLDGRSPAHTRDWKGINKAVTTTVTEERSQARSQSRSGESSSTGGDGIEEETRRAARVYERF